MIEKKLLLSLLQNELYNKFKGSLHKELFPGDLGNLYKTIAYAHEKYNRDIDLDEVYTLHLNNNPALTLAARLNIETLIVELKKEEPAKDDIAGDLILDMSKRELAKNVAKLSYDVMTGNSTDWTKIRQLVNEVQDEPAKEYDYVSDDIDYLLESVSNNTRWTFNIPSLYANLPGVGCGNLIEIFARPESGKTASWISLTAGPNGFLDQGAKIGVVCNEEPANRTMLRLVSCKLGKTKEQISSELDVAKGLWAPFAGKIKVLDKVGMDIEGLDRFIRDHQFDIVIVDQLDKIRIAGEYARDDQRLRALYTVSRELAKEHDLALFGLCQASAEAEGKLNLTFDMMENSRTGKAAEADVIIGIGRNPMLGEEEDMLRSLCVCKNKITGWHGRVLCYLDYKISRFIGEG